MPESVPAVSYTHLDVYKRQEETVDGVVMGNVECLPDDPALRLKILSKVGFLYFGAIEDKDRQLSGFLEVLVSYHGISKLCLL